MARTSRCHHGVEGSGCSTDVRVYHFTEMCSGSEAGSYLRLIDFLHHSTLGLRVMKKREEKNPTMPSEFEVTGSGCSSDVRVWGVEVGVLNLRTTTSQKF